MTAELLRFDVRGRPVPQGGKNIVGRNTGRPWMVDQNAGRLRDWRESVADAALAAPARPQTPWAGPVVLSVVFTLARPAAHYRTGRNAHLLRDTAPARPTTKPDLDKLIRAVKDALTVARVYRDDAVVVEYGRVAKVYINEDPDALDTVGARIAVWPLFRVMHHNAVSVT